MKSPAQRADPGNRPQPTEKQTYKTVGNTKLEIWIYKPKDWMISSDGRSAVVP